MLPHSGRNEPPRNRLADDRSSAWVTVPSGPADIRYQAESRCHAPARSEVMYLTVVRSCLGAMGHRGADGGVRDSRPSWHDVGPSRGFTRVPSRRVWLAYSSDLRLCSDLDVQGVCPMWASPPPDASPGTHGGAMYRDTRVEMAARWLSNPLGILL